MFGFKNSIKSNLSEVAKLDAPPLKDFEEQEYEFSNPKTEKDYIDPIVFAHKDGYHSESSNYYHNPSRVTEVNRGSW